MADANLQRLGDYVVARRAALGMRDRRAFAAATGITDRTLGKLENGKKVSASTLGAVENQLGWAPGSCRRILSGGEPAAATSGAGPSRYSDPTLQHIADTPGLPPDVVRGLIALARNWRDQADQAEEADERAPGEDGRQRPERRGA
jgi:transcriptional regulator with XRE-family HTH domain